jgi:hypothetical protein
MTSRILLLLFLAISISGEEIDGLLKKVCDANFDVLFGKDGAAASLDQAISAVREVHGNQTEQVMLEVLREFSRPSEQLIGCAIVLRTVGTMKSKETLIEALGHLPSGLMSEAVKALARLDGEGYALELAVRQSKEENEDRKANLESVLRELSGKGQFNSIAGWAQSSDVTERRRGISSLKHHPDDEARRLVRRALFDQDEQTAYLAIMSLGYIGEKNDLYLLQFLTQQALKKEKGLNAVALLSATKEAGQRIKERESKAMP